MDLPQRRVVILGASNVVRSLRVVLETASRALGKPLDVLAAIGHGRSYGLTSTVMGRRLPGILECDLWDEWRQRKDCPTDGLITDIGNDILYGDPPAQIASWVETCFQRLSQRTQRIIVTELPLESTSSVTPQRFRVMRAILFPRSRVTFEQVFDRAHELNARVLELATKFQATVVRPQAEWYGLDPIHILGSQQARAWQTILASWQSVQPTKGTRSLSSLRLWLARPKYRQVFGVTQRRDQPSIQTSDGTLISLY